ncbi:putative Glycosyltransferase family 25 protein [Seiridium cardinale]|uniref:Glycosyltransferase family 25 protein n=1 Tax=Seiridium cardinale TaxID=138064 RepID=A0ABR2XJZ7_9PEZI
MSPKPKLYFTSVIITIGLFYYYYTYFRHHTFSQHVHDDAPSHDWSVLNQSWAGSVKSMEKSDVFNRTLGFEQVFVIGFPERTDKRDAIALMSGLTDFDVQWLDGVRGQNIPDQALPFGWDRQGQSLESHLGSWRGHVNAIRQIIESRLSSALILEDDMDWDVSLKKGLASFAMASRKFLQTGFDVEPKIERTSPYGQNWDMLWLGACWNTFNERLNPGLRYTKKDRDDRKILIRDDPTVAPPHRLVGNPDHDWHEFPNNTRVVYRPGGQVCSFAYALSQSGARKALDYLSIRGANKPFDQHLDDLCRLRENGMRCLSITPALFEHHRPRGPVSVDSDILSTDNEDVREVGFSENIYYSTRLNINNLVNGRAPEPQWKD